jgi:hypothetical protein
MTPGRCLDCRAEFLEPTFSEGPKTVDPTTEIENVRFARAWFQCPACLSRNIAPVASRDTIRGSFAGGLS